MMCLPLASKTNKRNRNIYIHPIPRYCQNVNLYTLCTCRPVAILGSWTLSSPRPSKHIRIYKKFLEAAINKMLLAG